MSNNQKIASLVKNLQTDANGNTTGIITGNVLANSITTQGANLGPVGNLSITGGSPGYYLQTDGTGNVDWQPQAPSVPAGSNTTVQFNLNGQLTGDDNFRFTPEDNTVRVDNISVVGNAEHTGKTNLGSVANVTITGGSSGQVLTTNGAGALSWQPGGGGSVKQIDTTGSGLGFALTGGPITANGTIELSVPNETALRSALAIGTVANTSYNGNGLQFLSGNGQWTPAPGGVNIAVDGNIVAPVSNVINFMDSNTAVNRVQFSAQGSNIQAAIDQNTSIDILADVVANGISVRDYVNNTTVTLRTGIPTQTQVYDLPDNYPNTANMVLAGNLPANGKSELNWRLLSNSQSAISFTVVGNGSAQTFTSNLLSSFANSSFATVFRNGVRLNETDYDISGDTLTVAVFLESEDQLDVAATAGAQLATGGGMSPGGSNTYVQFNDNGNLGGSLFFTYNKTTTTLETNNVIVDNNLSWSNTATGNVLLANSANLTGNLKANVITANIGFMEVTGNLTGNVIGNTSQTDKIAQVTGEPTGFPDPNRTQSQLSFNSATRELIISPTGSNFEYWVSGNKYVANTPQSVVMPNAAGLYYVFYSNTGGLSVNNLYFDWQNVAPVSYVYQSFNNASQLFGALVADERHGTTMDWQTHEYLHRTRGAAFSSGFVITGTLGGNGSSNTHAQIGMSSGTWFDEDIEHNYVGGISPVPSRTWYKNGSTWTRADSSLFPYINPTGGLAAYNQNIAGNWQLTSIDSGKYGVMWIFANNDISGELMAIPGQQQYTNIGEAQNSTYEQLNLTGLPVFEMRVLYKIIFQTSNSFTNQPKVSQLAFVDYRTAESIQVPPPQNASVDIDFRENPQSVWANNVTSNVAWDTWRRNVVGNVDITGNLTVDSVMVDQNLVVTGNLTVNGNATYVNIDKITVEDPLIEVGTGANGGPVPAPDARDRGLLMHSYGNGVVDTLRAIAWDSSAGVFKFGEQVTVSDDVINWNTLGEIQAGSANLGNLVTANYVTGTLTTNSQPNITSTGTLENLQANGFTSIGNTNLGAISAVKITGGADGYFLQTDGTGNLNFVDLNLSTQPQFSFIAIAAGSNQTFTDTRLQAFANNNYATVFFNGVLLAPSEYSISGTSITVSRYLAIGDQITVAPAVAQTSVPSGVEIVNGNNSVVAGGQNIQINVDSVTRMTVGNANVISTVPGIWQANFTATNITSNVITANSFSGNVTTAQQANITQVGVLDFLNATGNITTTSGNVVSTIGNIVATTGYLKAQQFEAANTASVVNFNSNGGVNFYAQAGFNVFGAGIVSDGVVNAGGNITTANATVVARRFATNANGIVNSGSGTNFSLDWSRTLQIFSPTNATNITIPAPPAPGLTVTLILNMPSTSYNVALNGVVGTRCSGGSTSFTPGTQRACHIIVRSIDTTAANCYVQIDASN